MEQHFQYLDREDILNRIKTDIKESIQGDLPNVYLMHGDFTDDEMNEFI